MMYLSWITTTQGNQITHNAKFQLKAIAAKSPNVEMVGTSVIDVSKKAKTVVDVVTSIAEKARVHVHISRVEIEPLIRSGW